MVVLMEFKNAVTNNTLFVINQNGTITMNGKIYKSVVWVTCAGNLRKGRTDSTVQMLQDLNIQDRP
jgi:hypothetical protein